jgi:flagellar protein FlaI
MDLSEITGVDPKTERAVFTKLFSWDPRDDTFTMHINSFKDSVVLQKIAELKHVPVENIVEELEKRAFILNWMARNDLSSYDNIADMIRKYYVNPAEIYNKARFDT